MKGASSVIALLTALAAFGFCAAAIANAANQVGMSAKTTERGKMYYELDADAQRFLLFVDETLSDAETFAVEYVCAEGYASKIYSNMPVDAQTAIFDKYVEIRDATDGLLTEEFILETLNRVYFLKAYTWLQERRETLFYALLDEKGEDAPWQSPDVRVAGLNELNEVAYVKATGKFFSPADFNYHLTVETSVTPLAYSITRTDILLSGRRDLSVPHYYITRWDEVYTK